MSVRPLGLDGAVTHALSVLCRDCLAETQPAGHPARCRACGSPRLVTHVERGSLTVAHVDCDAFYAAVEKRDNPELRDKAVIVGGGTRGVVATCCYVARTFGIRSAMPMFKALKACPDAVVVPPDMAKYAAVGRQVRALMHDLTPLVEPLSIDEAFLDLTGTQRLHGATADKVLAAFARRIEADIGITVSIGLSYCKFLAKIASDLDKPRGFAVIGRAEARDFLKGQHVGMIWGVGQVTQDKLAADGYRLIGDLQRAEETDLMRRYGMEGSRLWRLANGIDTRVVSPDHETKSISSETTFDTDVKDLESLTRTLYALCEKVSARLKVAELAGATITLKLKTSDFKSRTRARALNEPTQLATRIFEAARELLAKEATGTAFRLIGVGAGSLVSSENADHGDLADTRIGRDKATEKAMDTLRDKFGGAAVVRGIAFRPSERKKP
ncbi:MAG: DNA-directed polymerase [Hyphomicrobiales bacterium]|nr:DNA-directed polymerase [Hyphomicrobiales bacterium]